MTPFWVRPFPFWVLLLAFVGGVLAGSALFGGDDYREVARLQMEVQRMKGQVMGWVSVAKLKDSTLAAQAVLAAKRDTVTRRTTDTVLVNLAVSRPECADVVRTCQDRVEVERANAAEWQRLYQAQRDSVSRPAIQAADTALAAVDTALRAVKLATGKRSLWSILVRPEIAVTWEMRDRDVVGSVLFPISDRLKVGVSYRP